MTITQKKILIIEDDTGILELLAEIVNSCGYESIAKSSASEAIDWLQGNMPFLILLDYGLPDINGKELINILIEKEIHIPPFIVSTGQGDERIAVEMMKLGASDYIIKDINFLDMIPIVIEKVGKIIDNEQKLALALESIRENEEKQRSMLSNISDVLAIIDINGINRYKSPNIEKIFGWKPDELIGQDTFKIIHPEDKAYTAQIFKDLICIPDKSVTIEFRYMCKDGTYKWVELTAINKQQTPSIGGILLNYHDISPRKNAEFDLIKAKERAEESDRLKTAFFAKHESRNTNTNECNCWFL